MLIQFLHSTYKADKREDRKPDPSRSHCPGCLRSCSWGRQQVAVDISTAFIQECEKVKKAVQMLQRKRKLQNFKKIKKNIPPPEQLDRLLLFTYYRYNFHHFINPFFRQCAQWQPHCNLSVSAPICMEGTGLDD